MTLQVQLLTYKYSFSSQVTSHQLNQARMKSRAALRFNRLHPDSLKDFQNILQTAKKRKESSDEESLDDSDEVTNMIKNKMLTKSREEDEVFSETERKKRKLVNKKITWSKNLIQVQILLDRHHPEI